MIYYCDLNMHTIFLVRLFAGTSDRSSESHPWLRGAILETGDDETKRRFLPLVVQSPERSTSAWEGLEGTSLA